MSRYFFFFQAEDGIRDGTVTGVQTCALPIWSCPFNTVDGLGWTRPPRPQQERFLAVLRNAGVTATLRREKGHDIAAACGQLRLQTERALTADFSPITARPIRAA